MTFRGFGVPDSCLPDKSHIDDMISGFTQIRLGKIKGMIEAIEVKNEGCERELIELFEEGDAPHTIKELVSKAPLNEKSLSVLAALESFKDATVILEAFGAISSNNLKQADTLLRRRFDKDMSLLPVYSFLKKDTSLTEDDMKRVLWSKLSESLKMIHAPTEHPMGIFQLAAALGIIVDDYPERISKFCNSGVQCTDRESKFYSSLAQFMKWVSSAVTTKTLHPVKAKEPQPATITPHQPPQPASSSLLKPAHEHEPPRTPTDPRTPKPTTEHEPPQTASNPHVPNPAPLSETPVYRVLLRKRPRVEPPKPVEELSKVEVKTSVPKNPSSPVDAVKAIDLGRNTVEALKKRLLDKANGAAILNETYSSPDGEVAMTFLRQLNKAHAVSDFEIDRRILDDFAEFLTPSRLWDLPEKLRSLSQAVSEENQTTISHIADLLGTIKFEPLNSGMKRRADGVGEATVVEYLKALELARLAMDLWGDFGRYMDQPDRFSLVIQDIKRMLFSHAKDVDAVKAIDMIAAGKHLQENSEEGLVAKKDALDRMKNLILGKLIEFFSGPTIAWNTTLPIAEIVKIMKSVKDRGGMLEDQEATFLTNNKTSNSQFQTLIKEIVELLLTYPKAKPKEEKEKKTSTLTTKSPNSGSTTTGGNSGGGSPSGSSSGGSSSGSSSGGSSTSSASGSTPSTTIPSSTPDSGIISTEANKSALLLLITITVQVLMA